MELEEDLLEEIPLALFDLISMAGAGAHQGLQEEGESPQEVGAEVRLEVPRSVSGAEAQAKVEAVAGQAEATAETCMSPLLTSVENIWKLRINQNFQL